MYLLMKEYNSTQEVVLSPTEPNLIQSLDPTTNFRGITAPCIISKIHSMEKSGQTQRGFFQQIN